MQVFFFVTLTLCFVAPGDSASKYRPLKDLLIEVGREANSSGAEIKDYDYEVDDENPKFVYPTRKGCLCAIAI